MLVLVALFSRRNSIEEKVIDFAYEEYKQSLIGPSGSVTPTFGSEFNMEKIHIDPSDMVNITVTCESNHLPAIILKFLKQW